MQGEFRNATLDEYVQWMKGYVKNGHSPTHFYPYPFAQLGVLFVNDRFGLDNEAGTTSRLIIVGKNGWLDPRLIMTGHNVVLFMKGFRAQGIDSLPAVPVFGDDAFLAIRGMGDIIQKLVAKSAPIERDHPLGAVHDSWTGDPAADRARLAKRIREERGIK